MRETTIRKALAGLALIPGRMPREDSPIARVRRVRSCPGEDRGGASGIGAAVAPRQKAPGHVWVEALMT